MTKIIAGTQMGACPIVLEKGISRQAGRYITAHFPFRKVFVVTDDIVYRLLGKRVTDSLRAEGLEIGLCILPHGEKNKQWSGVRRILTQMAASGMTRQDAVLALGGGVTGDMAGFAAGVYMRGIRYIQMPTTLLSMIDAALGGKTGCDVDGIKNLAGVFHIPQAVLIDTDILRMQPTALLRQGAGEMLKYGVLTGGVLFDMLASGQWRFRLADCARQCIRYKVSLTEKDPYDTSERRLLNLGHTFGHAIEAAGDFRIPHGIAVAMGIRMAFGAAETDPADYIAAMEKCGIREKCPYSAEQLMRCAANDKKRVDDGYVLVLPRAIGRCEIVSVNETEMAAMLRRGLTV